MSKILSKSRILDCAQCPKKLHLKLYRKDLETETDTATQKQFDEGHEVGIEAQKHFPGGISIEGEPWEYQLTHDRTQDAIKQGALIIYEASFLAEGIYARVDILKRNSTKSAWEVIEVKKAARVKDQYILDVAAQAEVLNLAGLKIKSYTLMHINTKCVHPDLSNLFIQADITKQVKAALPEIRKTINQAKAIASSNKEPKQDIGSQCEEPYDCDFIDHCWQHVPAQSVFELYKTDPWPLYKKGKLQLKDLDPSDYTGISRRTIEVIQKDQRYVDKQGLAKAIKDWRFPLYFFDFETINPAIPKCKGTSPYSQIPFQFSCHVMASIDSQEVEHFEYLHVNKDDPRPALIEAILMGFGKKGSIVAYNKGFEAGVLTNLARFDKENAKRLLKIQERLVDPLPLMRAHVYDKNFQGEFSIKYVAPALLGNAMSYDGMEVAEGSGAQVAAMALMSGELEASEFTRLRDALLAYCRQDTLAMVELVRWILREVGDTSR